MGEFEVATSGGVWVAIREQVWDELREKRFHNHVFDSLDALEDHLEVALRDFEQEPQRIRSIVAWPWIINALMN